MHLIETLRLSLAMFKHLRDQTDEDLRRGNWEVFSFTYITKAASLFFRYPSAIPKLVNGRMVAAAYVDKMRKREYSKKPATLETTRGFIPILNPKDSGVSPDYKRMV